jgi:hypothetical protein
MRFLDPTGSAGSVYWLRAVNSAGRSVFSQPAIAR